MLVSELSTPWVATDCSRCLAIGLSLVEEGAGLRRLQDAHDFWDHPISWRLAMARFFLEPLEPLLEVWSDLLEM